MSTEFFKSKKKRYEKSIVLVIGVKPFYNLASSVLDEFKYVMTLSPRRYVGLSRLNDFFQL